MLIMEVDISKLNHNLDYIKYKLKDTSLCAVVKAEAYGHGFEISKYITDKCDSFAVADILEAATLRKFTDKKIYILGGFDPEIRICDKEFVHTLSSFTQIDAAIHSGLRRVSLKLNTGMNRLGFSASEIPQAIRKVTSSGMELDSIYTHLYNPQCYKTAHDQLRLLKSIQCDGVKKHCCASNFLFLDDDFKLDAVRCGLAMYGYGDQHLQPIAKAYSRIVDIHNIKKGMFVGYGETKAAQNMRLATVEAGYADGINRKNIGKNLEINNRLCPIIGNVCMDMCMVDITNTDAKDGDKAYFIGDRINAEQVAVNCDTIVYEILTSFRGRVRRKYING